MCRGGRVSYPAVGRLERRLRKEQNRVATRLVLKYNIRGGGDHHLGPQVLLAVELDALFDGDEADLAMDQRFHDLDHLPAVGDGFHGSVQ